MNPHGFIAMLEASQKGKERSLNVDEMYRKQVYPDKCSPTCEHATCGYRIVENEGKICFMRLEQFKTPPQRMSNPLARIPNTQQRQIEEIVKKAFEPLEKRLREMEQTKIERNVTFNGKRMHLSHPLKYKETLRVDQNMNKN